jgi:hypothetical protein
MARILVVGGSLGGLFAANLLWRDGHDLPPTGVRKRRTADKSSKPLN